MSDNRTSDERLCDACRLIVLRAQLRDISCKPNVVHLSREAWEAALAPREPLPSDQKPIGPPNEQVSKGGKMRLKQHEGRIYTPEPVTSNPLLQRLRDHDAGDMHHEQSLVMEAADEIERLRAALKTVGDDYPGSSCQKWCYEQAGLTLPDVADEVLRRFARAAEIQAERCEHPAPEPLFSKTKLSEDQCKELMRRIYAAGVCSDTYRHKLIRTWFEEVTADVASDVKPCSSESPPRTSSPE